MNDFNEEYKKVCIFDSFDQSDGPIIFGPPCIYKCDHCKVRERESFHEVFERIQDIHRRSRDEEKERIDREREG